MYTVIQKKWHSINKKITEIDYIVIRQVTSPVS